MRDNGSGRGGGGGSGAQQQSKGIPAAVKGHSAPAAFAGRDTRTASSSAVRPTRPLESSHHTSVSIVQAGPAHVPAHVGPAHVGPAHVGPAHVTAHAGSAHVRAHGGRAHTARAISRAAPASISSNHGARAGEATWRSSTRRPAPIVVPGAQVPVECCMCIEIRVVCAKR